MRGPCRTPPRSGRSRPAPTAGRPAPPPLAPALCPRRAAADHLPAAYVCVASCFRVSDVHQLLPALLSPLLIWLLFAFQVFTGPDVAAPPEVLYTLLIGGPMSVTALSVWEIRRLRGRHGITLRTAPGR